MLFAAVVLFSIIAVFLALGAEICYKQQKQNACDADECDS